MVQHRDSVGSLKNCTVISIDWLHLRRDGAGKLILLLRNWLSSFFWDNCLSQDLSTSGLHSFVCFQFSNSFIKFKAWKSLPNLLCYLYIDYNFNSWLWCQTIFLYMPKKITKVVFKPMFFSENGPFFAFFVIIGIKIVAINFPWQLREIYWYWWIETCIEGWLALVSLALV